MRSRIGIGHSYPTRPVRFDPTRERSSKFPRTGIYQVTAFLQSYYRSSNISCHFCAIVWYIQMQRFQLFRVNNEKHQLRFLLVIIMLMLSPGVQEDEQRPHRRPPDPGGLQPVRRQRMVSDDDARFIGGRRGYAMNYSISDRADPLVITRGSYVQRQSEARTDRKTLYSPTLHTLHDEPKNHVSPLRVHTMHTIFWF